MTKWSYADAGDYGYYITTLNDKALEEYNAKHPDTPIDVEKFNRGETVVVGMDTEYNAPNTALVGKTLSLTADTPDGKTTYFLIDGSFYFGDYKNNLSEGIGQRKDIHIVPEIIYVSKTGMERLTGTPVISAIGVNIKDRKQLKNRQWIAIHKQHINAFGVAIWKCSWKNRTIQSNDLRRKPDRKRNCPSAYCDRTDQFC